MNALKALGIYANPAGCPITPGCGISLSPLLTLYLAKVTSDSLQLSSSADMPATRVLRLTVPTTQHHASLGGAACSPAPTSTFEVSFRSPEEYKAISLALTVQTSRQVVSV